ncbi:hypothetical protein ACUN0C_12235 [Faunimonas sp. B44]|uniref:hypothetical protein n=1 Tax=Faunimonas sp. B44 TaxID=3461493 RepID=UPI004043C58C
MDRQARTIAQSAIDALDEALAAGPEVGHETVAAAVRQVIALRNHMIDDARQGRLDRRALDQINAVTSLAFGAEYPLMGVHLRRMEQVREQLSKVLDEHESADAR